MIASEARITDNGHTYAVETVQKIVAFRLSHPLASQSLIAEMTGNTRETVCRVLNTPFAKAQLDLSKDVVSLYADKLREMQGDAVEYMGKSISRGHRELSSDTPSAPVLTNARECATTVSKITGLLKDQVQVRTRLTVDDDYRDIASLASDPAIVAFLGADVAQAGTSAGTEVEAETDPTGVAGEGGPCSFHG